MDAAPVPLSINCMTLATPQAIFSRLLDGVVAAAQLPLKPAPDADPFIQPGATYTPAALEPFFLCLNQLQRSECVWSCNLCTSCTNGSLTAHEGVSLAALSGLGT